MTVYAPRVLAHPTRTGAKRTTPILYLVVHTSEGGETGLSAEQLAAYIATPRTDSNLASYHYIADTDRVIPVVPDGTIAYAAGGGNANGLHICHPGKANQTAEQWGDTNSSAQLEQVAQWLAEKADRYDIPLRHISPGELQAGRGGVCGHVDISNAFHKSTHTDPGSGYPWPDVIARANELAKPNPVPPPVTKKDRMYILLQAHDDSIVWLSDFIHKTWVQPERLAQVQAHLASEGRDATVHPIPNDWLCAYGILAEGQIHEGRDRWGALI